MKATCKRDYAPVTISITFESEYELELFTELMSSAPRIVNIVAGGGSVHNMFTMMSQIHLAIKQQRP